MGSLGLNLFIGMLRAVRSHKFHLWTQSLLEKHNHTMELRMFGEKLVMTDDPENIKAMQDTQVFSHRQLLEALAQVCRSEAKHAQFSEFAKSEEQRIIFQHIFGDAIFGSTYTQQYP